MPRMRVRFLARGVIIPLLVVVGLLFLVPTSADVSRSTVPEQIASLDRESVEAFGVGLVALVTLLEARPENVFLVDSLAKEGRMSAFLELERAGYVTTRRVQSGEGDLLGVTPTEKAAPIIKALRDRGKE